MVTVQELYIELLGDHRDGDNPFQNILQNLAANFVQLLAAHFCEILIFNQRA